MSKNKKIKKRYPSNVFDVGGNITSSPLLVNAPGISVDPSKVLMTNPYAVSSTSTASPNIMGAVSGGINLIGDTIGNLNPDIPKINTPTTTTTANSIDTLLADYDSWSPLQHITKKDLGADGKSTTMNALGSAGKGAATAAAIGSVIPGIGTVIGGVAGGLIGGISSLFGSSKKKKAVKEINKRIDKANDNSFNSFANKSKGIDTLNDMGAMANFAAYGGNIQPIIPSVFSSPLGSGAIAYEIMNNQINLDQTLNESFQLPKFSNNRLANGGILSSLINEVTENKGASIGKTLNSFNGISNTGLLTSLSNLSGLLYALGGDINNGVTVFGNGGTHEENPYLGIPLGIGQNGLPNLVEEGEVKYNDYIFSDRITADKDLLSMANLPKKYKGKTMAKIAEDISKESKERPNDSISKRGLEMNMNKLTGALELIKGQEQGNVFAKGGKKTSKSEIQPFKVPEITTPFLSLKDYEGLGGKGSVEDFYNPKINYYASPEEIMGEPERTYDFINPNYNKYMAAQNLEDSKNNDLLRELNLRYAPVLGAALGLGMSAFSGNDKFTPDYTGADTISGLNVAYQPIGNYLGYNPLDRNYYLNMMNAQAGATRRGIVNQSAGNRATATAGLLAADYNYLNAVGTLGRQAEEYNLNQRQAVENFNRGTNMFNSEAAMKAALANNDYKAKGAAMRSDLTNLAALTNLNLKQLKSSAISANLTNLFDSVGDIGREAYMREMIQSNPALLYDINRFGTVGYKKAKGGKLSKRNKNKGLTDGII